MPAERGAGGPGGLFLPKEQAEFKRFGEADVLKLGRRRHCLQDIAPIERSSETRVRRALRSHERMFA
jgi:hypothetical protein